jgi:hypothetical protein
MRGRAVGAQGILESMIADSSAAKDSASETTRKVVQAHAQGQVRALNPQPYRQ